ncbi:MAG: LPS export ABC transporter periplasmic protein LptC [Bacteroidales bacterium]|nr:LPS export ABC transporter periplasmic protein LptC [Bacteroidales bacterium]
MLTKTKNKLIYKLALITLCISASFVSCTNDMEKVAELTATSKLPTVIINGLETIYSDSAVVKMRLTASEFQHFETAEESYDEYPSGMKVEFFNENLRVVGQITCEYAKYLNSTNLWEARKNVEAISFDNNEKINTEHLFWDMEKEEIYSDKYVIITTKDEIIYGDGFISNQDFTAWKITKPKGTITIENED